MAYANLYGIPTGISALALALLWGLFLLSVFEGNPNRRLPLLILAAALLTVYQPFYGFGSYFFPPTLARILGGQHMIALVCLSLAAYLLCQRERSFWKLLGRLVLWSAGALLAAALISAIGNNYLWRYLGTLADSVLHGQYSDLVYWALLWLILLCTVLSAWSVVTSIIRGREEVRALTLRNTLVMNNYRALENRMQESAALHHEFSHQIAAMDALLQAGDLEELRRRFAQWRGNRPPSAHYTKNIPINSITQDAAARAKEAQISFQAYIQVPERLPIPDEDLCALLMNMLDNALEGAARTPRERPRSIAFHVRYAGGFLAVLCENTFDGMVNADAHGRLHTRKADRLCHGFGLPQMSAVAEKYGSLLDVQYTDDLFTVQTALRLPETGAAED